jgi:hypothetical protein
VPGRLTTTPAALAESITCCGLHAVTAGNIIDAHSHCKQLSWHQGTLHRCNALRHQRQADQYCYLIVPACIIITTPFTRLARPLKRDSWQQHQSPTGWIIPTCLVGCSSTSRISLTCSREGKQPVQLVASINGSRTAQRNLKLPSNINLGLLHCIDDLEHTMLQDGLIWHMVYKGLLLRPVLRGCCPHDHHPNTTPHS